MPPASAPSHDLSADDFADLPNVPLDLPDVPSGSAKRSPDQPKDDDPIDFDDLSRRFDELKKRNK